MNERFAAWRFDGRTAEPRAASVRVEGLALVIESPDAADVLRLPIAEARISEPFEHAPRFIYTDVGEIFEVSDGRGISRAIEAAGFRDSSSVRLQRLWPVVSGALVILLIAFACAYVYGLPAAARWAALARSSRESRSASPARRCDRRRTNPSESNSGCCAAKSSRSRATIRRKPRPNTRSTRSACPAAPSSSSTGSSKPPIATRSSPF